MNNKNENDFQVPGSQSRATASQAPVTDPQFQVPDNPSLIPRPEIAISVKNISKSFRMYNSPAERLKELLHPFKKKYHKDFWALRDISLEIPKGMTYGIIGQNGSGKSTLLQIICGILQPTTGSVQVNGRISALLELGAGFNRDFTGRENVFMNGAVLGISRSEMEERFDRIVEFADIGNFINQPVKTYSSGMYVRLAFAVAINVDPEILIVDEALAVGDVRFQARCFEKIEQMRKSGVTILFVTHATQTFQNLCNYGLLLDNGVNFAEGEPKDVSQIYYKLQRDREHAYQEKLKKRDTIEPKEKEEKKSPLTTKAVTTNGEFRFGLKTAQIVDFKVFNHEAQETQTLETGKKFTIWIKIEFYDDVNNPSIAAIFRNPQGQNLLGIHTFHERRMNLGKKKAGDRISAFLQSDMLLNPGKYTISLSVADCKTDYDYKNLDSRNHVVAVDVDGPPFAYGLVYNPATIEIEE